MGTTVYDRSMTQEEARAECDRLCTWDNQASRSRVLASGINGGGYYAAVETISDKGREVWAAVFKITLRPFSYKDMCESMGPYLHAAPRAVLEALEPLPERNPQPCGTCKGEGKLIGERWSAHAQGETCFSCDGIGEKDRHDSAREWRKSAWSRFGGQPQGVQMGLAL